MLPTRGPVCPNLAVSAANDISQNRWISFPPPTQKPRIFAMLGLSIMRMTEDSANRRRM